LARPSCLRSRTYAENRRAHRANFISQGCALVAALDHENAINLERFHHAQQDLGRGSAPRDAWGVEQKKARRSAFPQSIKSLD
jgi:hypothetical protein